MARPAAGAAVVAVLLALLAPQAALAGAPGRGCVRHSLSVTPIGTETMLDTYIDNECGVEGSFTISYLVQGPCPHTQTIAQVVEPGAVDVVTFHRGPCAGHYVARQRITRDGYRVGLDTAEFDAN